MRAGRRARPPPVALPLPVLRTESITMNEPLQRMLTPLLQRWLRGIADRATAVATACVVFTLGALVYAFFSLGINADNLSLVSKSLESRKNHAAFAALFPNLEEALLIVVDGETPALAREATDALSAELASMGDTFRDVYVPGGGAFFEENALLYRTPDELDAFADQLSTLQPILASLEADPSLVQLAELVRLGFEEGGDTAIEGGDWTALLDEVGDATVAVYEEAPVRLSWESIILAGSDLDIPTRRVIVVDPHLEYERILVAASTLAAIEGATQRAGLQDAPGVRVRVTGNPALNHEEMLGLFWDIAGAGVFCFALVAVLLYFAFRSWRLVIASLATLIVGLVWTGAFAALTIGELNLISIAFAILFIGLGVDFAIHFGMAFADERRDRGLPNDEALRAAIDAIGASLVLCGFTTAIGFLVFLPTEYRGVAELGAIAGAGMFIILFLTITLFPALLLGWLRIPDDVVVPAPSRVDQGLALRLARRPRLVVATAGVLALGALPLLLELRFDAHVIEMRDPDTPSVQAFRDLLANGQTSPWYVNVMAPTPSDAERVSAALESRPEIGRTVRLASYVPEEQEEKLEILMDLAFLMEAPPISAKDRPVYSVEAQTEALRTLRDVLRDADRPADDGELVASLDALEARLDTFVARIETDEDPARVLADFREILLARFPDEIARFRRTLEASEVTLEDLPAELARRLRAPDGTLRIQVYPEEELQDFESLKRFISGVLEVAPRAAGIAINLVDFGEATARSFRQALLSAALAISTLLFVLWRRPADVALVLAPLALGSLLTCASMAIIDMQFNFANVLVLPLLFGIGVDSGIHLVHRARHLAARSEPSGSLAESATAGAVFYSAMTTTLSFGTLALSGHEGMRTLGVMLTIGMFWTVVANLVFLPALLVVTGVSPAIAEATRASRTSAARD
ncbi:MAG: MMPL family transporter [Myxococcota bacterium]